MVSKYEIIKEAIIGLFGEKALEDKEIQKIVKKYAEDTICLEPLLEKEKEDEWMTLQYNNPSLPHGFIYYDCHKARLKDLLEAVEIALMLQ